MQDHLCDLHSLSGLLRIFASLSMKNVFSLALAFLTQTMYTYVKWISVSTSFLV